jgi:release factor glutamine methyltransferase
MAMTERDKPWTVLGLLHWTKGYFAQAGVNEPRLAAEILLAHVLTCRRIELYTRFEYCPSREELAAYRALVARAQQHEPVAYLVGQREFYSMRFEVRPEVLIPRPETEILVDEAIAHLRALGRPSRMWDVCTGCGCVAVAAARHVPGVHVLATDISAPAVEIAAANAARHDLSQRVVCRQSDLLSLPSDCAEWRQVDFITANPPYVADSEPVAPEVEHEPDIALYAGKDGLDVTRRLVRSVPDVLAPGGRLAMEFGMGQAEAVCDLLAETDAFDDPQILCDQQDLERTVVVTRL